MGLLPSQPCSPALLRPEVWLWFAVPNPPRLFHTAGVWEMMVVTFPIDSHRWSNFIFFIFYTNISPPLPIVSFMLVANFIKNVCETAAFYVLKNQHFQFFVAIFHNSCTACTSYSVQSNFDENQKAVYMLYRKFANCDCWQQICHVEIRHLCSHANAILMLFQKQIFKNVDKKWLLINYCINNFLAYYIFTFNQYYHLF